MTKGYKVVLKYDGELRSSYAVPESIYSVGKKTKREKGFGPLCVFSSLKEARRYKLALEELKGKSEYFSFELYSCEYKKSRLKRIWNTSNDKIYPTVNGTELAEWVMLKEKIE